MIEPSRYDADTAYVAVDRHKLDDIKPYVFKTADGGKTWTRLDAGLPDGAVVHAVREDPVRRGLLYAGTETGVFVSFDDGAHWQSLQLNLPRSPVHDLVVKGDDLVVATHGRSFWILDDVTPLRQMAAAATAATAVSSTRPRPAYRLYYPDQVDTRPPGRPEPARRRADRLLLADQSPSGEVSHRHPRCATARSCATFEQRRGQARRAAAGMARPDHPTGDAARGRGHEPFRLGSAL